MKELKRKDVCRKTNLDQEWISARDIFAGKPALQLLSKPILLFTRMSALGGGLNGSTQHFIIR